MRTYVMRNDFQMFRDAEDKRLAEAEVAAAAAGESGVRDKDEDRDKG